MNKKWNIDDDTIINVIKLKGKIAYPQIASKFTKKDGRPLNTSDVQCICNINSKNRYDLNQNIFQNRTDITYDEYIAIRSKNFGRGVKSEGVKKPPPPKKTIKVSIETIISILLDKRDTKLSSEETAKKYTNNEGKLISKEIVKNIWQGRKGYSLAEDTFEGQKITYQEYVDIISSKGTSAKGANIKTGMEANSKVIKSHRKYDFKILVEIIKMKHTSKNVQEIIDDYYNSNGFKLNSKYIYDLWRGHPQLYQEEFTEDNCDITYQDYLEIINKSKI